MNLGLGLRHEFFDDLLRFHPEDIDHLEIHSENYFDVLSQKGLLNIRQFYPISMHGVGLGLGSWDKPCVHHLKKIKQLVEVLDPWMVSEHLACTHQHGTHVPDLLPLVYSQKMLERVTDWIDLTQSYLGRPIILEHLSRYAPIHPDSDYHEIGFLHELCRRSGCGILMDFNNLHLNQINLGESMNDILLEIDWSFVREIHLAGVSHQPSSNYQFDTHDAPVHDEVLTHWANVMLHHPNIPVVLEWDQNIPSLSFLQEELKRLRYHVGLNEA
jgi:uncharacterized protein (UPF0276 family)